MLPPPPRSTLFPYTTLFRSWSGPAEGDSVASVSQWQFLNVVGGEGTRLHVQSRPLATRSEEHTSELQSRQYLVCRLLLEKKKTDRQHQYHLPMSTRLYRRVC